MKGRKMVDTYEVLPELRDETGEEILSASFTTNNGIRIQIRNDDLGPDWAVFDFTAEQAETVGSALLRWALARAAQPGASIGDGRQLIIAEREE